MFLVRKSCGSNRHLPDASGENSTLGGRCAQPVILVRTGFREAESLGSEDPSYIDWWRNLRHETRLIVDWRSARAISWVRDLGN